jgi:hydrogenase maturation protease
MTPSCLPARPGTCAWTADSAATTETEVAPTAPYVVVGLGNEIASDDGVGIHVAHALEPGFRDRSEVEVVALPWAGFALLDVLRGRRRAALIDCLTSGVHPPGSVVRLDASDFRGSVRLNSFHDISYPTAMALGRSLGWEMPDEVAIWGVEAAVPEEFGETLSPEVAKSVAQVVHEVTRFIDAPADSSVQLVGAPR